MSTEKRYAINSIFRTIQGEGCHAGTAAVFVRFGGCNMWSGVEANRVADAERNGAHCPRWCDTNFSTNFRMTAFAIANEVGKLGDVPLVVFTGGEPLLQLDDDVLSAMRLLRARFQVETNGTVELPPALASNPRVWVTMSPKVARDRVRLSTCHELKLVYPAHDPAAWETFPTQHRFLQPQADRDERNIVNERSTAYYVERHPDWRLSVQVHKVVGIP